MRVPLVVLAVVALWVTPLAIAGTPPPPPTSVVVVQTESFATLSWSPVVDADEYVVYRGATEWTLAPIATTAMPYLYDEDAFEGAVYGVSAVAEQAEGGIHMVAPKSGPKGNCVAANTNLHVTVTISNCLRA